MEVAALDRLAVRFVVVVERSHSAVAEELEHIPAAVGKFAPAVQMHTDCLQPEQHIGYLPDMHIAASVAAEKCSNRLPAVEVANN